jgi:hypothetical protein
MDEVAAAEDTGLLGRFVGEPAQRGPCVTVCLAWPD